MRRVSRISPRLPLHLLAAALAAALAGGCREPGGTGAPRADGEAPAVEETDSLFTRDVEWRFRSRLLGGELVVLPGVFGPWEAEWQILPFLERHAELFRGRRVLEIGTGSGAAGIYVARLGAQRVVATDILPNAVESARRNAARFGVDAIFEARLVVGDDVSAYAAIGADENFDIVLSNPPFSLDLDASRDNAVTDTGDLGFSIVDGLEAHLRPGGAAVLYYGSLFYHLVMVKYARHRGYEVASHRPELMTEWEASVLFNSYLERLLRARDFDPRTLRFSREEDALHIRLRPLKQEPPLLPEDADADVRHPGWMIIRRPPEA